MRRRYRKYIRWTQRQVFTSAVPRINDRIRKGGGGGQTDRSWERTLRDRTGTLNPSCFNWRCAQQILLPIPHSSSSVYLHRRIDPRVIKWTTGSVWRATLSGGCAGLPAEGWHRRVCPLEQWKHADRGWWPFFRSAQIRIYRLLRFPREQEAFSRVYCSSPFSSLAERNIRCYPVAGHNHLWRGPAILDISPINRAIRKSANARHASSGRQDLTHPIIGRPKKVLPWPSRRRRTSPDVLDTLCRSFDSRARDWLVCRLCFLCVMRKS